MSDSRGNAISAYSPPFAKGAQVYGENIAPDSVTSAKMNAAFLSGTIVSGGITTAIAHGLGVIPKIVVATPLLTAAQATSATTINVVVAAASAATATNIYLIGSQPEGSAIKYSAYVQL